MAACLTVQIFWFAFAWLCFDVASSVTPREVSAKHHNGDPLRSNSTPKAMDLHKTKMSELDLSTSTRSRSFDFPTNPEKSKLMELSEFHEAEVSAGESFQTEGAEACPEKCSCKYDLIVAVDCSNRNLTEIPRLPSTSVKVQLQNNFIRDVSCTKLTHLKRLQELDLSRNELNTLHNCSFSNLTSLKRLRLTGCNLNLIPLKIFDPLEHLLELELGENKISEIKPNLFARLQRLLRLDLGHNSLSNIPNGTFQGLYSLNSLSLPHNNLHYVPGTFDLNAFDGLKSLTSLHLEINHQTFSPNFTYPDQALASLQTLEKLWLDGYSTPLGVGFSALQSLRYLSFSGVCSMSLIQDDFFLHVSTKKPLTLNLSYCHISDIHPMAFSHLSTIYSVDLCYNEDLSIDGFEKASKGLQNSRLTVLNISKITPVWAGSSLKNTSFQYLKNTSLKVLIVESCQILTIDPKAIVDLPQSMEYISLHENLIQLSYALLTLVRLRNLKTVKLSEQVLHRNGIQNNKSSSYIREKNYSNSKKMLNVSKRPWKNFLRQMFIPQTSFRFKRLSTLKLKYTQDHQSFCKDLDGIAETAKESDDFLLVPLPPKLEVLYAGNIQSPYPVPKTKVINNYVLKWFDISNSTITCFGGPLYGLPKLQHIDMSKNFAFDLNPFFFSETSNLKTILLNNNKLGRCLANDAGGLTFSRLPLLETLDLSLNVIEDLPERMFQNNGNLKTLNLSNNVMREFQLDVLNQRKLELLDLSYNSILGFSKPICTHFLSIKKSSPKFKVNITGNTDFRCSCDYLYFLNFLLEQPNIFTRVDDFNCRLADGSDINYNQLQDFLPNFGVQCITQGIFVVSLVTFFLVSGSLAIVSVYFYKRWQWRYLYYVGQSRLHIGSTYLNYKPVAHSFLTYDQEDIRMKFLIMHQVLPRLRQMGITTVLGEHDFCGAPLAPSIASAVTYTEKTLVFLSKDIFQEFYRQLEINLAIMHELHLRRPVLVPVLVLDVESIPVPRLKLADSSETCSLDSTPGDDPESLDQRMTTPPRRPGRGSIRTTARRWKNPGALEKQNLPVVMDLFRRFPPEISVFLRGQVHRCLVYAGESELFWQQLRDVLME